jgi:AbrB family looped-hinge helix DNA binding protein
VGKTAKVTSKGQVTIPKEIREHLDSRVVEFEIENDKVILRAVRRVAGDLKRYANPDLISQEEGAWAQTVKDRHENR